MKPSGYEAELQRLADERWPGAGVEVSVKVWQPLAACEKCLAPLEQLVDGDGRPAGRFYQVAIIDGHVIRSPHYAVCCDPDAE